MKYRTRSSAAFVALAVAALACNLPTFGASTPPAAATLGQLYTAAALTVQAGNSQVATATPSSTTAAPFPTISTLAPSRTPVPVALCDAAAFIADVTIPDGAHLDPGAGFTKTWRLQNVGTCSWTPAYALVFVSGDRLGARSSAGLTGNVNPGQSVDLSVDMTAPTTSDEYEGLWKLRNGNGSLFGIGAQAQTAFWVRIHVAGPTYTAYDFVSRYCDAAWDNNNRALPCPGTDGDGKGYVIAIDNPLLENGRAADRPGLLTVPKDVYNGMIAGTYPAVKIRSGDRFQALVECEHKAYSCNVVFRLEYQIGGGSFRSLGHWNEAYEGKSFPVDIDLSSLAGENVTFILSVWANGNFNQDLAMWIGPRIMRAGTPPPTDTPTATATATATTTPTFTPTPTATATSTP